MIPKELLAALRKIEIFTAKLANQQLSGTYTSSFKGQGLAFREVRPYQPGDDVRTIDWNVSARMSETFVKVFVEEREMTVMLVVDLSPSQRFGTRRADKISRRLARSPRCWRSAPSATATGSGSSCRRTRSSASVPPKKGEKHVMRVIREILGFDYSGFDFGRDGPSEARARQTRDRKGAPILGAQTDLTGALEALVGVARRRSIAFIVSDFFAQGYERALALAAARHDIVPVTLVDPRDLELPDVGLATFEDLESGEAVVVDTSDSEVRAHYAREMKRLSQARVDSFNKLGLDSVEIETGGSFVTPLRNLFARRARRAHLR